MKAPRSCPNSSDSCSDIGIAAQLTGTNGELPRPDIVWIARATSSLPVPVSPRMHTLTGLLATRAICRRRACIGALSPISVLIERFSSSMLSRWTRRVSWRRSSARATTVCSRALTTGLTR